MNDERTTPETSDLAALIRRLLNNPVGTNGYLFYGDVLHGTERDEIVIALRVLRVLRQPRCFGTRHLNNGTTYFNIDGEPFELELDEAERILGIGGGK